MPNYVLFDQKHPESPRSYALAGGIIHCNNVGSGICYIIAGDNGLNQPIITTDVLNAIIQSYVTGQDSDSVKIRH